MKFISNRDHTVVSTRGHSIAFAKGVPTYVPPEMHSEVKAAGALPEEDMPEETKVEGGPPDDPAERKAAIVGVIESMVLGNARGNFTAAGAPHTKVLQEKLGWEVPSKERDEVWAEMNAGKAD